VVIRDVEFVQTGTRIGEPGDGFVDGSGRQSGRPAAGTGTAITKPVRGPGSRVLRGDAERERKEPTQLGQIGDRGIIVVIVEPKHRPHQLHGVLVGQGIQGDLGGAVTNQQPGQPAAAGDERPAGRCPRQQRPHLVGVVGIVEQHKHAPLRHHAAELGRLIIEAERQVLARDSERTQKSI
jgi:hypothetical protein